MEDIFTVDDHGTTYYNTDDNYRLERDLPAIKTSEGEKQWWKKGMLHRDGDKPAIIRANGDEEWLQNGKRHRDDGKPAVVRADGTKEWYVYGYLLVDSVVEFFSYIRNLLQKDGHSRETIRDTIRKFLSYEIFDRDELLHISYYDICGSVLNGEGLYGMVGLNEEVIETFHREGGLIY